MKILMLKGLPGSGKSTWAKEFIAQNPGWVRINKDDLRAMMGGKFCNKKETDIIAWRDLLLTQALSKQLNVVIDDTNFAPKHEERIRKIAEMNDAEFEVKFFDVPLEQCIKNDLNRIHSVGERIIKKIWRQYLALKIEPPKYNPELPDAIICDLDGTIALHNGRSPYDTEECLMDVPCPELREMLELYCIDANYRLLFVTGREAKYMTITQQWLANQGLVYYDYLYMRPTGDFREDSIIKQEVYDTRIKGQYNVRFVLDDRNRVVNMWRGNGLKCFQVADGDF